MMENFLRKDGTGRSSVISLLRTIDIWTTSTNSSPNTSSTKDQILQGCTLSQIKL